MQTKGFTLVELLVAVVIISIMLGVGVPALTAMLSGRGEDSAKAMIRAMLARAQAHAAANQKYAGIRFQFDALRAEDLQTATQYMVLIEKASPGVTTYEYNAVPDESPTALPKGIGVIITNLNLDLDSKNLNLSNDRTTSTGLLGSSTFSIIFSPTGQLVSKTVEVRWRNGTDNIFSRPALVNSPDPAAPLLYHDKTLSPSFPPFWSDSEAWCTTEPSATGLYIFNTDDMMSANPAVRYSTYVNRLKPMLINTYTGELIED